MQHVTYARPSEEEERKNFTKITTPSVVTSPFIATSNVGRGSGRSNRHMGWVEPDHDLMLMQEGGSQYCVVMIKVRDVKPSVAIDRLILEVDQGPAIDLRFRSMHRELDG